MIEFFQNILNWIVTNANSILLTLGSIDVATVVMFIISIIKSRKTTMNNTLSNNALKNNMSDLSSDVKHINTNTASNTEKIEKLEHTVQTLTTKLIEAYAVIEKVSDKIDAILDVQSIAYSTVKDTNLRNAISNIIVSSKYLPVAKTIETAEVVEKVNTTETVDKTVDTTVDKTDTQNNKKTSKKTAITRC